MAEERLAQQSTNPLGPRLGDDFMNKFRFKLFDKVKERPDSFLGGMLFDIGVGTKGLIKGAERRFDEIGQERGKIGTFFQGLGEITTGLGKGVGRGTAKLATGTAELGKEFLSDVFMAKTLRNVAGKALSKGPGESLSIEDLVRSSEGSRAGFEKASGIQEERAKRIEEAIPLEGEIEQVGGIIGESSVMAAPFARMRPLTAIGPEIVLGKASGLSDEDAFQQALFAAMAGKTIETVTGTKTIAEAADLYSEPLKKEVISQVRIDGKVVPETMKKLQSETESIITGGQPRKLVGPEPSKTSTKPEVSQTLDRPILKIDNNKVKKKVADVTIQPLSKVGKRIKNNPAFVKVQEAMQDNFVRVKRLMQEEGVVFSDDSNPYLAETLFHGRVGARRENIKSAVQKLNDDIVRFSKKTNADMNALREKIDSYLVARHAPERNKSLGDGAAGIKTGDAKKLIRSIEGDKDFKAVKKFSDSLQELNNKSLDVLLEGGVISKDLHTSLRAKFKNHVPLQRIMDDTPDVKSNLLGGGLGFNVKQSGIKAAKGSKRRVADITTNIAANLDQATILAEKNKVNLATLEFYRKNKDLLSGLIDEVKPKAIGKTFNEEAFILKNISDPTTLHIRENGKPVFLRISDPELAKALQGVNLERIPSAIRGVATLTRFYSSLATRFNPEFFITNLLRDVQGLIVNGAARIGIKGATKAATSVPKNAKAIVDSLMGRDTEGAKIYNQMVEDGGTTGGLGLSTREQIEIDVKNIRKIAESKPRKAFEMVIKSVDNFNQIFEDSTRLSIYRQSLKDGLSRKQAAFIAKNATVNFNKKGTAGPLVNALWMFSNASIQGGTNVLKSMTNPKVAFATMSTIAGASYFLNQYNDTKDPDWRKKVSDFDKNKNLVIVLDSGDDKMDYVTIPMEYSLAPIKVVFDKIYESTQKEDLDIANDVFQVASAFLDAYNPVGGSDFASAITPTVADPIIDIARNKKWNGSMIYPEWKKDLTGPEQIFAEPETTKEKLALKLSEFFYNSNLPNTDQVSPEVLEFMYETMVGGTGRAVNRFLQTTGAIATKDTENMEKRDVFLLNRFFKESKSERWGKILKREEENDLIGILRSTRDTEERKDIIRDYLKDNDFTTEQWRSLQFKLGTLKGFDTKDISISKNPRMPKKGDRGNANAWYGYFRNHNLVGDDGKPLNLTKEQAMEYAERASSRFPNEEPLNIKGLEKEEKDNVEKFRDLRGGAEDKEAKLERFRRLKKFKDLKKDDQVAAIDQFAESFA